MFLTGLSLDEKSIMCLCTSSLVQARLATGMSKDRLRRNYTIAVTTKRQAHHTKVSAALKYSDRVSLQASMTVPMLHGRSHFYSATHNVIMVFVADCITGVLFKMCAITVLILASVLWIQYQYSPRAT